MPRQRIVEIAAARPNFMKVAPIHRVAVDSAVIEPILIHTGQHYDPLMSDVFFSDLALDLPDIGLGVGSGTHAEQTARVLERLEPHLDRIRPRAVVVVGDVNSTLAAALCAVKLRIPVAHVEAGLRSFDREMPEEINRVMTDSIADILFTPSGDATENLIREGHPGRIASTWSATSSSTASSRCFPEPAHPRSLSSWASRQGRTSWQRSTDHRTSTIASASRG